MARTIVLAYAVTEGIGLIRCLGARPGDVVAQAIKSPDPNNPNSTGDDVTGVFHPVIPGADVIAQAKNAPGITCLLQLHRFTPDG